MGYIVAALAGAGLIDVGDPVLYEHPELFLKGLLDIFS